MPTFEKVRLDGTIIPVGVAIDPGALASGDGGGGGTPSVIVCNATWSNDVLAAAFGDWTGHSIGPQAANYRALITFDISGIAVGAPISAVELETTTNWVSGNAADSYYLGPYNLNGAANPQTDGAALAYTRADCSTDNYLAGDTQYRTTGQKTFSLGAQAIADILAIRAAAGTIFTLALRQTLETGTQHYSTIEGWTMGAEAPKLRVMLTAAPATVLTVAADHSNDVDQNGARGDYTAHAIGVQTTLQYRTYIRFPLAQFPTNVTPLSTRLEVDCAWVSGNSADRYVVGPYNGNGLGNPSVDTGAQAFARSDASADFYLYGDAQPTAIRTLLFELGAQACIDLKAAIDASATYFSISLKQISETLGSNHYAGINGYNTATPPKLTISATAPSPSPSITSVGSGTLNDNDTTVGLFGAAIGTTKSNGWLELNSAANGSGTSVVQTTRSWANGSIVFDVVPGALSMGTVYAIVHDNNGNKSAGYSVTLQSHVPPPPPAPVITGLSTSTLTNGKTGVVITGTDFGATQGAGYVELNTAADGSGTSQTQTITAWSDTAITITVARGSLPYGRLYLLVHSDV